MHNDGELETLFKAVEETIRRKAMLQKHLRNIYRLFSLKIMCRKSNLKTKSY